MRRLNPLISSPLPFQRYKLDEPEFTVLDIWGSKVLLDCNSLAALLLESDSEIQQIKALAPAPDVLVTWMPNIVMSKAIGFSSLMFDLGGECDLSCEYCRKGDYPLLEFDIARIALDRYYNPGNTKEIHLVGANPMLYWDFIIQLHAHLIAKVKDIPMPRICIWFPGTELRPKRLVWMSSLGFSFVVYIDGAEEHYNGAKSKSGQNAWSLVHNGLKLMRIDDLPNRITLLSRTSLVKSSESSMALAHRAEALNTLCDEGYASKVIVDSLDISEAPCSCGAASSLLVTDVAGILSDHYQELAKWFVRRVKEGRPAREATLERMILSLLFTGPLASGCNAGMDSLYIGSNGQLAPCAKALASGITFGRIQTGGMDESLRWPWMDSRVYCNDTCMRCPIRWLCHSSCRAVSDASVYCQIRLLQAKAALYILCNTTMNELLHSVASVREMHNARISTKEQSS